MANYNNALYIEESIKSILEQEYKDWELIIVDDCSIDNSVEKISKNLGEDRIRFYKNELNQGYIATLKKMISLSSTNILTIVDSDDAINKNALKTLMKVFLDNPSVGLVYSQNWHCDENLKILKKGYSQALPEGESNLRNNYIHHLRAFKKSEYLKTSGYDEDILYAEDIDIILKLEEVTEIYFIDKPLYYYRVLKNSQTHGFRNEMINRSSAALAKYNAYKRREMKGLDNLDKNEITFVLFLGLITSVLSFRVSLFFVFLRGLFKISPFFIFNINFYKQIFLKIKKIKNF